MIAECGNLFRGWINTRKSCPKNRRYTPPHRWWNIRYDLEFENVAYAYFVRSTAAYARITEIDIDDARNAPGVVGVITADELGIGQINPGLQMVSDTFARTPLATDTVRYVGDPIVVIVAETFEQAVDAAELVYIDYDYLTTIVDPEEALDENTEPIFLHKETMSPSRLQTQQKTCSQTQRMLFEGDM